MRPLTVDDLLSLDEYNARRAEYYHAHLRYLDRYRRVRLGPRLTLIFENRQTLWYRVQEILRVARLADPLRVQLELDWFNRLLPRRGRLQASLLIDLTPGPAEAADRVYWQSLSDESIHLRIDQQSLPVQLVTCRPEDRCFGTAYWVEIAVPTELRPSLIDQRKPVRFEVNHAGYCHESLPLSADIRQSLYDDLELSERDG
jgi:hypothetical protein